MMAGMSSEQNIVTVQLDAQLAEAVDSWAQGHGLSRHEAIVQLIGAGLSGRAHNHIAGDVGSVTQVNTVTGDLNL